MARYDSEGYNRQGRRQIFGYSRQVQGGADAARARANQRLYESQDHLYEDGRSIRAARQRAQRVAAAKVEGDFTPIRDTYNKEAQASGANVEMDNSGTIRRKPKTYTSGTGLTPKPARSRPMSFKRPADQGVLSEAVDSTSDLLSLARKARRRGTLVVK
jgi:hypothetical protein